MSEGAESNPGPEHPETTNRSGYRYFFYIKHHQPHNTSVAQWNPQLASDEEFAVFNFADEYALSDENGNLYGFLRVDGSENVRQIGTRTEQIAQFPHASENQAWHGYPIWPVRRATRSSDRDPEYPQRGIPDDVLQKMVDQQLLTKRERKRVKKGSVLP